MVHAVKEKLSHFTTLVAFKDVNGPFGPIATGTLVRVGDRDCILTAAHVWEASETYESVGLTARDVTHPQALAVDCRLFKPLHVSPRPPGGWTPGGPDIAVLEVPAYYAADLKAGGKAFYNLSKRRANARASAADPASGIWFIIGALGESVAMEGLQPDGSQRVMLDLGLLASRVRAMRSSGPFDLIELSLDNKLGSGFPSHYRGLSGAGLWCVGERGDDGKVRWTAGDPISLEGVAFYHDPGTAAAEEVIICHGRRSVYDYLLAAANL